MVRPGNRRGMWARAPIPRGATSPLPPANTGRARADGLSLLAHELAHVVQQSGDAGAPVQRDLAIEPKGVNKTERKLSEKDINDAIAFNKTRIKKKETIREIRDVIGIDPDPAVSDRDLALGVGALAGLPWRGPGRPAGAGDGHAAGRGAAGRKHAGPWPRRRGRHAEGSIRQGHLPRHRYELLRLQALAAGRDQIRRRA